MDKLKTFLFLLGLIDASIVAGIARADDIVSEPGTIYCYYSHLAGSSRHYNYVTIPVTPMIQGMGIFTNGRWHVVTAEEVTKYNELTKNGYAYVLDNEDQIQNLVNLCDNRLPTSLNPRFESVRVSGSFKTRAGILMDSFLSYFAQMGYPVITEDTTGKLGSLEKGHEPNRFIRIDARYDQINKQRQFEELTQSIIFTRQNQKPRIRKVSISDLNPYHLLKAVITEALATKVAYEIGVSAERRIMRFFYEDPNLQIRNVKDNSINQDLYIATKQPEVMKNFLAKVGINLDSIFGDVHWSVNWAIKLIRQRFEHMLAASLSKSIGGTVALSTRIAAKAMLYRAVGMAEDKIAYLLQSEKNQLDEQKKELDEQLEAGLAAISEIEEKEISNLDSEHNKEILASLQDSNTEIDPEKLSKAQLAMISEMDKDIRKEFSLDDSSKLGGINRIRHMRNKLTVEYSEDYSISATDVINAKLSEVKIRIHAELHNAIRESVEEGLRKFGENLLVGGAATSVAISVALTPLLGPGAVLVTGGLSIADLTAQRIMSKSFLEQVGQMIGDRLGRSAGDLVDNTNLPLPKFLQVTEADIKRVFSSDHDPIDGFYLVPTDDYSIQSDNPNAPTVGNYVKQQAKMVQSKVKNVVDHGIRGIEVAHNAAGTVINKVSDATGYLANKLNSWLDYLIGEDVDVDYDNEEELGDYSSSLEDSQLEDSQIFYSCSSFSDSWCGQSTLDTSIPVN